jgi:excisionase family DNA binding protein
VDATDKILLSYKEAAKRLSISERTLWTLAHNGQIPTVRIGPKGVRFRVRTLDEWAEQQEKIQVECG